MLTRPVPASVKLPEVRLRRIRLYQDNPKGQAQVFTVAPSEVLPYMTGYTDEVEKALFLRRFGVPFWGLTYVFGRDDSYWERLSRSLGAYAIVGTTLKDPHKLPEHVLADEKHVHFNGQRAYIATTVAQDCVLGASLALNADEPALTEAYSYFKQEAQTLLPDYAPRLSIPMAGWPPKEPGKLCLSPLRSSSVFCTLFSKSETAASA